MATAEFVIREAVETDFDQMWEIFKEVIANGDTYVFSPEATKEDARAYLLGPTITTFVAARGDEVLGMYKLIANQRDLGSHVSNASFMVSSRARGRGLGRALGLHCLAQAKERGFYAMQFNFVVSTNPAVKLWQELGFEIVGTLPSAFHNLALDRRVDVYVMYRLL